MQGVRGVGGAGTRAFNAVGLGLLIAFMGTVLYVAAVLTSGFGLLKDPDRGDLEHARVAAEGLEVVRATSLTYDWFDGDLLSVYLVPGADRAEAERVWCEALLPNGVTSRYASVSDGRQSWRAPDECEGLRAPSTTSAPHR